VRAEVGACWLNERIEPPSWMPGDQVIAGAKGILFVPH
jgi:hypothetical protein